MRRQGTLAPRRFGSQGHGLDTLLYLPEGYLGAADEQWPLVFFLHDEGERGEDVEKLKTHGLPRIILNRERFPFVAICPQCPEGHTFEELTDELMDVLDAAVGELKVDPRAVLLTGMGMGADAAWKLAAEHPKRFAALAPVGGKVCHRGWTKQLAHQATWAFHGAEDEVSPPAEIVAFIETLRELHAPVRLTLYPEASHEEVWQPTYEDPALYEWFLRQSVVTHQGCSR